MGRLLSVEPSLRGSPLYTDFSQVGKIHKQIGSAEKEARSKSR